MTQGNVQPNDHDRHDDLLADCDRICAMGMAGRERKPCHKVANEMTLKIHWSKTIWGLLELATSHGVNRTGISRPRPPSISYIMISYDPHMHEPYHIILLSPLPIIPYPPILNTSANLAWAIFEKSKCFDYFYNIVFCLASWVVVLKMMYCHITTSRHGVVLPWVCISWPENMSCVMCVTVIIHTIKLIPPNYY